MLGRLALAHWKRALRVFSDYPTYLDMRSEAETLKKVPFFCSETQALAKKVFPVPGGYITKELRRREEYLSMEFFVQ